MGNISTPKYRSYVFKLPYEISRGIVRRVGDAVDVQYMDNIFTP